MKKLLFLVALVFAASARGQSTLVVTSSNYPTYPVGAVNVPISLDSGGRMILSAGSGVAAVTPKPQPVLIAAKPKGKPSIFRTLLSLIFP